MFKRNKLWFYLTASIFITFNGLLMFFLSFGVSQRDLFFNENFFIPSHLLVVVWIVFGIKFLFDAAAKSLSKVKEAE